MTKLKNLSARAVVQNALVIVAIVLITIFATNLTNSLTGELDFAGAIEAVAAPFGGWLNLLVLLGELALIGGGAYMLYRAFIKENDMQSAVIYTIGVLFALVMAALVGLNWVVFPSGTGIMSLIVIVVIVGGALLMRTPFKTARVESATDMTPEDEFELPSTPEHQFTLNSPYNNTDDAALRSV